MKLLEVIAESSLAGMTPARVEVECPYWTL